jgi:hypothetical protein
VSTAIRLAVSVPLLLSVVAVERALRGIVTRPTVQLPRRLQRLADEAIVTADGPHPAVRMEPTARLGIGRRPRRPCHKRAIHSSPERSRADNHGQPRSSLDLRRSHPRRCPAATDLALGAGGHACRGSDPAQRLPPAWCQCYVCEPLKLDLPLI